MSKKFIVEIFEDDIIEWISKNFNPEEVFDEDELFRWAKEKGATFPDDTNQE